MTCRHYLHHHRHCRSLGQNFLLDDEVLRSIVAAAGVRPGDLVLEIGPGAVHDLCRC